MEAAAYSGLRLVRGACFAAATLLRGAKAAYFFLSRKWKKLDAAGRAARIVEARRRWRAVELHCKGLCYECEQTAEMHDAGRFCAPGPGAEAAWQDLGEAPDESDSSGSSDEPAAQLSGAAKRRALREALEGLSSTSWKAQQLKAKLLRSKGTR